MKNCQRLLIHTWIYLLLFCLPVSSFGADKVTLQLIWKNQFQFAGYYAAKELGYYSDLGLDVEIKEYEFGIDITQDVLSQNVHFGVGRSSLILEKMEGKPVYLLAAIYQHSPFMLLAKTRDDLKSVSDLKGKRIMVSDDVVGMASMNAMLTANRVEPGSYIAQKHTFNTDDLVEGKTDAIAAYISNEPFQMKKRGVDYTIFSPKAYGFDFYSDILFTSEKLYDERPDLVERFHEASLKGWEYAFSNIEQTVEIILAKFNSQDKNREALLYEGYALKDLAYDQDVDLGNVDPNRVNQIAQVYNLLGLTQQFEPLEDLIYSPQSTRKELGLTQQEKAWLRIHSVIRVHNEKDWAPFNFYENGSPKGFSIDYMNLLASILGVEIQYISGPDWDEFIEMMKDNRLDVMLNIAKSPEREKFLAFTPAYVTMLQALYTREDYPPVSSIKDLHGKSFAVPKGFYLQEVLKSHPEINIFEVSSVTEAIYAVSNGKADALFDLMPVVNYITDKQQVTNLKVGGDISILEGKPIPLHIGVSKGRAAFAGILTKAMKTITDEELKVLREKWFGLAPKREPVVSLTSEETAWVSNLKNPLRVANEMDWPPFDFAEGGEPKGFSIDMIKLVAEKVGIKIDFVNGLTWKELLEKFKRNELDILPAVYKTAERQEYISFTSPYAANPSTLVLPKDSRITNLEDLEGKTLSVVEGFATNQIIADRYPGINQVNVTNVLEGLKSVSFKKSDAFVGDLGVITFILEKNFIPDIKLTEEISLMEPSKYALHVGVAKEKTILRDILQKGLDSISSAELSTIRQRWLPITVRGDEFDIASILSAEEIKWLSKHQNFRLGVDPAWAPFEFFDDEGNYSGIGSSYAKTVEERLNVKMKPLQGLSWSQALTKARAGEVDIFPTIMRTKPRDKFLNFTDPYISLPIIIAARKDSPFIDSLSDLVGMKVGVVEGYATIDLLNQDYPNLDLINHKTLSEGLEALNDGNIDAFVDNLGTITYELDRNRLNNIKIAAPTEYNFELSMGVRKDWPELVRILNKILASMSDKEHRSIKNSWIALEVKIGLDLKTILAWAIPTGSSVILIIVFVLAWNRRLGKEIETRKRMQADLVKLNEDAALRSSQLQKANIELSERDEIFQSITSAALSAIIMIDNDGKVIFWNKAAESIFGWQQEEITGKNLHDLVNPPQFQEAYINAFKLFRESGKGPAIDKLVELSALRKNGEKFLVEISLSAVNLQGKWCAIGIVNDISERKKAEDALQQSDHQNKVIIENSPLGIVHLNKEGKILRFNTNAVDLFGSSPEKLAGFDTLKHLRNESFKQAIMTALKGEAASYEGKYTSVTGGKTCFLRGIFNPIDKNESLTEVIATFEDITERKRMEREMVTTWKI